MERAARISGARFGYWIGDTARLSLALYRFALDRLAEKGFVTVLPPVLVREEALIGTGAFPSDEPNVYELPADGLYLAGTAEIPLAASTRARSSEADELPLRYVAFSPCFRREAGAAGRDTRGMFRVHQFNKVEQFSFTTPEASWDEHELLLANTEELVRRARPSVPRRRPARGRHVAARRPRPTTSRSGSRARSATARRPRSRTRPTSRRDGSAPATAASAALEPVHTLNGTAVVDRMALAILENFGGDVPEVLRPYGAPARVER